MIVMLLSWLVIASAPACTALQDVIRIGGLFDSTEAAEELAFRYAAESINADYTILRNHTLMTHYEKVPPHDSFHVSRTVCKLLGLGVAGIFGPQSGDTSDHVQSMCDAMDVPHIETRWDVRQRRQDFLVNLYPHPATLSKLFADIVTAWGWKSFTVIYEDGGGLVRLADLIKIYPSSTNTMTLRQIDPSVSNHRGVLREIMDSGEKNIVLDCSIDKLPEILKQIQQVGLLVGNMSYIITNLDFHTLNLEPFQWSKANITGIRLVDPQNMDVQLAVRGWSDREMRRGIILDFTADTLRLRSALIYDAVFVFAKALARLDSPSVEVMPIDCNQMDSAWNHGSSLINFMKDGERPHRGLTGLIQFDNEGFRSKFELDLMEMTLDGLQKIGTWNTTEGLNLTRTPHPVALSDKELLHNMHFRVLIALADPYGMEKTSTKALVGNNRYEGFCVDIIKEMSQSLGFNYTFEVQRDNAYGAKDKVTGKWDGMISQLLENTADLAITDLTISKEREEAVDFTMPFMNLGISILYKAPTKEPPKLHSFLSTFAPAVWYAMLVAYIGVSMVMFVAGRISPKEWTNPYPCIQDPDELENQFSLKNAFWFTIGSLMQQGSEIAPIAISTRMIAGIWWFFTLIMVSSYTANLAAVLAIESTNTPFTSVEGLAAQTEIKYGAKKGGSTANFFRDAKDNVMYQNMWRFMESQPPSLTYTTSNPQGKEWVKDKNRKYAFFMESVTIEYMTERDCAIQQVGGLLDAKGYGIAMRKNTTYRNDLSTAVLKLQESGRLSFLKQKWWKEERGGGACDNKSSGSSEVQLSLAQVLGVFVVLGAGVSLAVVFTIIELVYESMQTAFKEKVSFRQLIMEEVMFIGKLRGSTKPVRKYNSNSSNVGDVPSIGQGDFGSRGEGLSGTKK